MTPDDKRESAQAPKANDESSASGLDELAGGLPSVPPAERAGEEEADPKSLAALAAQRPSVQEVATGPGVATGVGTATATGAGAGAGVRSGNWAVPLLIGMAIGAAGASAVFTVMRPPPAAAPDAIAAQAPAVAEPEPPAAEAVVAAAAPEIVPLAEPAAAQPAGAPDPAQPLVAAAPLPKERASAKPGPQAAASAAAEPPPGDDEPLLPVEPPPPPPPGTLPDDKKRAMDDLLDDALSPTARNQELARRQQAALTPEQLPLTPSREDANKAMTVLLPAIRGCAMGQSGLATANMVVRADGRVAGVEITGAPFAGSASGRCMEGVIRRARFSPFRQATLRIKFPLAIQ